MLLLIKKLMLMILIILVCGCAHMTAPQPEIDFVDNYQERIQELSPKATLKNSAELANKPKQWPFKCINTVNSMSLKGSPTITTSFIEADLREVLLELSIMTSIPIVFDDSVEGLVSIDVTNYKLRDALELILSPDGFTYRIMENYILIGSPQPDSPSFPKMSMTCTYQTRHQSTLDIISSMAPYYRQYVQTSESSQRMTLTAPPSIIKNLQSHILRIDTAPAQVKLELSIIEVSANAMSILGVSWGGFRRNSDTQNLDPTGSLDWRSDTNPDQIARGLMLGQSATRTLRNSIHALRQNGQAEIKATPSIVTLSGKEANFSSTQTVWLPYQVENGNGRSKELTYGIDMKLVPYIADNNNVKLTILNASVSDYSIDKAGVPNITSHSVTNTVNVKNGDYLVLGGLLQEKSTKTNQGVPMLGKIPGLGWMFGGKQSTQEKREVLILIRPVIERS